MPLFSMLNKNNKFTSEGVRILTNLLSRIQKTNPISIKGQQQSNQNQLSIHQGKKQQVSHIVLEERCKDLFASIERLIDYKIDERMKKHIETRHQK